MLSGMLLIIPRSHKVLSNGDKKDNLLRHYRVDYYIRSTSINFADDFAYFFSGQVLIYLKADYPYGPFLILLCCAAFVIRCCYFLSRKHATEFFRRVKA